LKLAEHHYVSPYSIAVIFAALNEPEPAFAWLERAHAERTDSMTYLNVDSRVDGLRQDARFAILLRRVGLAE